MRFATTIRRYFLDFRGAGSRRQIYASSNSCNDAWSKREYDFDIYAGACSSMNLADMIAGSPLPTRRMRVKP